MQILACFEPSHEDFFLTLLSYMYLVRFQVLTVASTKMIAFWDVAACSLFEED
jgi:hypothetical protein